MVILLILSGIICIWLSLSCLRLRADIRYLHEQLGEIERGSHIELAVYSRRQSLLAFCRRLNRVLQEKDASHNRYEKAEKKLKQNITDLAHDIRTPLTGASGYVQLARESTDSIKKEHYLEVAGKRLAELSDMLEELFLYTRLTDEDYSLPKESLKKTYVLPLLSECLLSLYSAFEERGTSPEIDFASEDFCIYAEEEILQRIFLNLIRNALLHGRGGITILQKEDLHPGPRGFPRRFRGVIGQDAQAADQVPGIHGCMFHRIQDFQMTGNMLFCHPSHLMQKQALDLGNAKIPDLRGRADLFSQATFKAGLQFLERAGKPSVPWSVRQADEQIPAVMTKGPKFFLQFFQRPRIELLSCEHVRLEIQLS